MFIHFLELFMATMAIRISDEDHKLFVALAEREHMPLSVLVRRTLHAEAVRVGMVLDPVVEAERATKTEADQAVKQESSTPAYGVNDDGSINHRLRVAKARGLAIAGVPKAQVAKVMGLTIEQIESACIETAKQGISAMLPWHSSEKVFALGRLQANPQHPVPDED
jgi:hypothetical protein